MSWKKLLESVSESLNDHIQFRNDYLMAENRILRNQIDGRVQLTDSDRKELADMGAKLGKKALAEIATVATPDTILAWHRKFANEQVKTAESPKSVGCPRIDKEIEDWVIRMARENRSWGYDRIQGTLNHLGYTISDQTVGNILKRHGLQPAPERKKTVTWREFVRSHLNVLVATGFFNSEIWNWIGLAMAYLLSFVQCSRHQVDSLGMTLYRQSLALQSLIRQALDLSLHMRGWVYRVMERSGAKRAGKTARRPTGSEVALVNLRRTRSQRMGKVLVLSDVPPRPIRDGPIQRQQSLSNHHRKAA